MTSVLGISAFYHDSAASLIINGKIIAAAQEERFSRIKHDSSYPANAINFVLDYSNLSLKEIDYIVFFEKPFLKFERILETYLAFAPKGFIQFTKSMPVWLKEKLFQKKLLIDNLNKYNGELKNEKKLFFSNHHLSHAASAFYPSNFEKSLILTADGVGEWATTTVAIGDGNKIEIVKEIDFPHSLGLLYSSFTYYLGFKVNSGEYKLMGLAPYGTPKYKSLIYDKLINVKKDGSFHVNQKYFDYSTGLKMINNKFCNLFGFKSRNSEKESLTQFHMDIAASIQSVTEEILIKICRSIKEEYKINNLCMAGGVALNCVANGKILKEKIFENIWIQPAAGDAGGSLGAALAFWYLELKKTRHIETVSDSMKGSLLGPEFTNTQIQKELEQIGAVFYNFDKNKIIKTTAIDISNGLSIGWFQGRMEFGPRALGSRSIIADPRNENMQKNLNLKIKFRESFRPFAPSILEEDLEDWFELNISSPYMLFVSILKDVKQLLSLSKINELFGIEKLKLKRSKIPAVTHIDYSARIQTINRYSNLMYFELLKEFKRETGCPILINTSFNVRGEPIVCSPIDAYSCFMGTGLDRLVIGDFYLRKEDQPKSLRKDYSNKFSLD